MGCRHVLGQWLELMLKAKCIAAACKLVSIKDYSLGSFLLKKSLGGFFFFLYINIVMDIRASNSYFPVICLFVII